jgi:ankyrin repeat protein
MKKAVASNESRKKFLKQTMAIVLSASVVPSLARESAAVPTGLGDDKKPPPLAAEMVSKFVGVSHFDLAQVKDMLSKEPGLINATWDQGGGDFETALGAASHVGNREIAAYLLQHGARKDIFCAAMYGERELVASFIKTDPTIVNVKGPHKIPLLSHVALCGDIKMADLMKQHLSNASADCNHAIHPAIRSGQLAMIDWLFQNGADDPNILDFKKLTPLQAAEKKGSQEMVALLKKYGAK